MSDSELTFSEENSPRDGPPRPDVVQLVDPPPPLPRSLQRPADPMAAEIAAARLEVEQLRRELAMIRERTSNTVPDLIRFVLEGDAGDNLVSRRPSPYDVPLRRSPHCCLCSIM